MYVFKIIIKFMLKKFKKDGFVKLNPFTKNQIEEWGIKYHELFLGKPSGDIYIDDKGEKDEDFFNTRD